MRVKPLTGAKTRWAAHVLALLICSAGVATLPSYGLTTDEGFGHVFFGQRYFHFFRTLDDSYLDFRRTDLPIDDRPLDLSRSPLRGLPWVFPPLADTLSAATMEVFGHGLGWLDPIDAFHLATVLMVGVLLVVLYEFAAPRFGPVAALAAVVVLGTYPRFWGDMHNNPKDIPQAVFFSLTIFAFVRWYERPRWPAALLVGALGGAALAVKVNALFLPFVLILGVWPWAWSRRGVAAVARHVRSRAPHYAAMLVLASVVFVAAWPYLYRRTVSRLVRHFVHFASQGGRTGASEWNPDPLVQTVATMPESVLVLLVVGLAAAVHAVLTSDADVMPLRLALAWLAVPLLRASVPGAVNFDGIRHFVEFVPAAALLAGYGTARVIGAAVPRDRPLVAALLAGGLVANVGAAHIRYHPYQPSYFNSLVGGLAGARRTWGFLEATDYWGSSYRQGAAWLRRNAPPGAAVFVPVFPWLVEITSPSWMPELRVLRTEKEIRSALAAGQPVYVMFVTRTNWYDDVARHCEEARAPVHQIVVDGLAILKIYRLDESGDFPEQPRAPAPPDRAGAV